MEERRPDIATAVDGDRDRPPIFMNPPLMTPGFSAKFEAEESRHAAELVRASASPRFANLADQGVADEIPLASPASGSGRDARDAGIDETKQRRHLVSSDEPIYVPSDEPI